MADLRCETDIPNVNGLKDQQITVGRHVHLQCTGEIPSEFKMGTADVKLDENSKITVKVIKAGTKNGHDLDVDLVFYTAGDFKFDRFILSDGKNEIQLGLHKFKIESVIEKPKDGKPPEPFGPVLPITLSWPVLYTWIILAFFLALCVSIFWYVKKQIDYKRLVSGLKDYDSSLAADLQFYRSIRLAESKNYPITDLDKALRLYVLRIYRVPMFNLKDNAALSFFKKQNPWLKKERLEVKKLLGELQSLEKKLNGPSAKDIEQLKKNIIKKIYQFIDQTESAQASRTR